MESQKEESKNSKEPKVIQYNKNGKEPVKGERVCAEECGNKYKVLFSKKQGFFDPIDPLYKPGDEFRKHTITNELDYNLVQVNKDVYDVYVEYLQNKKPNYMSYLRNLINATF